MNSFTKVILTLIIVLITFGIITVFFENTGALHGGTGLIGSIIIFGLIFGLPYYVFLSIKDKRNKKLSKFSNFTSPKKESPNTDKNVINYENDHPLKIQDEFVKSNLNLTKLRNEGVISEKEYKEKLKLLIGENKTNINENGQKYKKNFSLKEFNNLIEQHSKEKIESIKQLFKNKVFTKKEYDLKLDEIREIVSIECLKKYGIDLPLNQEIRKIKIGDVLKVEIIDENLHGDFYKDFSAIVSYINLSDLPNIVVWNSKVGLYYKFNSTLCTFIKHDKLYESKFNPKNYLDFKNNVLQ